MAASHGGARKGAGRKPGAVGKAKRDLANIAKGHAGTAIKTLVIVMTDEDAPHSARVNAANAILDRGYGKPFQSQVISGDPDNPVNVVTEIALVAVSAGSD